MLLSDKKLFLLDMDGTIYLDETIFDGTLEFLDWIKTHGGRYVFLTNNSSKGTASYIEKMARMGIKACPGDFFTSADATIDYIHENKKDSRFYVCGTKSLKKQLSDAGITICESREGADTVLLGYDTELNFEKLENCCILLQGGADYIATHPDLVCPTWYGGAPDCGSVMAMLKIATGREPLVIGKPKPAMALSAMKKFGVSKEETCLIGDRLYTDIACGNNAGVDSIFVLSGEGVMSDIEKFGIKPSYIFNNIREVLDEMKRSRV